MEALVKRPYTFDFFHLVRLLEARRPELPRVGFSTAPAQDPVRFWQNPSLRFAPAAVEAVRVDPEKPAPRVAVNFFGLFGPNAPMPPHLTEYALEREIHHKDTTITAFFNTFQHRLLSLFYRAWAANQKAVDLDRPKDQRFAVYLGALFGIGMDTLRERDAVPDRAKLFFAGRLSCQTRNAEGLEAILREYFHIPVEVQQFIGRWLLLPGDSQCELGQSLDSGSLGINTILGSRFWDSQLSFRMKFGPMSLADYVRMLPPDSSQPVDPAASVMADRHDDTAQHAPTDSSETLANLPGAGGAWLDPHPTGAGGHGTHGVTRSGESTVGSRGLGAFGNAGARRTDGLAGGQGAADADESLGVVTAARGSGAGSTAASSAGALKPANPALSGPVVTGNDATALTGATLSQTSAGHGAPGESAYSRLPPGSSSSPGQAESPGALSAPAGNESRAGAVGSESSSTAADARGASRSGRHPSSGARPPSPAVPKVRRGEAYQRIKYWVLNYCGEHFFWDAQLVLRAEEVPEICLGQAGWLGYTTWLKTKPFSTDADELILNPPPEKEL